MCITKQGPFPLFSSLGSLKSNVPGEKLIVLLQLQSIDSKKFLKKKFHDQLRIYSFAATATIKRAYSSESLESPLGMGKKQRSVAHGYQ